jgi:hypothetical protein
MTNMMHDIDSAWFYADIENRTRDLTKRIKDFTMYGPHAVHPFVITVATAIVDLIGYHSDSSIDEYQNSINPYIDAPDYAEEYAICGYDDKLMSDPTSAEYRAFATEVDEYFAVYNHLSDAERELIASVSDAWAIFDEYVTDAVDAILRGWFDRVMTYAENSKTALS